MSTADHEARAAGEGSDDVSTRASADAAVDPETDLRARWLPSTDQVDRALAALAEIPAGRRDRFIAVVPLAQPGKRIGLWQSGQEVVCLPGVWVGENTASSSDQPLSAARDAAEDAAEQWLRENGLSGTAAIALVHPDGHAAVFEGFTQV